MGIIKEKYHYLTALSLGVAIVMSLTIVGCKNVSAQSIETLTGQQKVASPQIKVGGMPEAIAVNEETNKVYTYNPTNGTVSVINSNTGGTVKNIRVGPRTQPEQRDIGYNPIAVDQLNNKVYVANEDSDTVYAIDGNNDTIIGKIKVGKGPFSVVIGGPKVYVGSFHALSIINGSDYTEQAHNIVVNGSYLTSITFAGYLYAANSTNPILNGTVLVIDQHSDAIIAQIKVGKEPSAILVHYYYGNKPYMPKVYVANSASNTVSVFNGDWNNNTGKRDIHVGNVPASMTSTGDEIYVGNAGSNNTSVINISDDTNKPNITLGFSPYKIVGDQYSHKVYVPNSSSKTVSVIDSSNHSGVHDKQKSHDIVVGLNPAPISFNSATHMIYVGNSGSNTVSVINGFTSKVAAGVTFNVHPGNSGTIVCGNKEYPTGTYMYVDNGTSCRGQGKGNFEFDGWVQNTGRNSTSPVDDSSGNLTVDRYGTFTANFKPLPPPIPPEYTFLIISVIVSSLIGWSIPTIVGWIKERNQHRRLKECIGQIGKLNRKEMEEKAIGYYVDGKIDGDHHKLLKDKIAEYYGDQEN